MGFVLKQKIGRRKQCKAEGFRTTCNRIVRKYGSRKLNLWQNRLAVSNGAAIASEGCKMHTCSPIRLVKLATFPTACGEGKCR